MKVIVHVHLDYSLFVYVDPCTFCNIWIVVEAYHKAACSMARLNRTAALLMHKYSEYTDANPRKSLMYA